MQHPITPEDPRTQAKIWQVYRDYFDLAEKKRRWNLREDIPWDQCNPGLDPVIADVVETFCMVELFLPDYLSKQLPQVRGSKGRAWMLASWGYEESKHSMVLNDWMLKGGHRTEEQLHDMDNSVFEREWTLKYHDPLASVVYTMVQEVATRVNYRNLRKIAGGRCPVLRTGYAGLPGGRWWRRSTRWRGGQGSRRGRWRGGCGGAGGWRALCPPGDRD